MLPTLVAEPARKGARLVGERSYEKIQGIAVHRSSSVFLRRQWTTVTEIRCLAGTAKLQGGTPM